MLQSSLSSILYLPPFESTHHVLLKTSHLVTWWFHLKPEKNPWDKSTSKSKAPQRKRDIAGSSANDQRAICRHLEIGTSHLAVLLVRERRSNPLWRISSSEVVSQPQKTVTLNPKLTSLEKAKVRMSLERISGGGIDFVCWLPSFQGLKVQNQWRGVLYHLFRSES